MSTMASVPGSKEEVCFHICAYLGLAWLPQRLEMDIFNRMHGLGLWKMFRPVGIIFGETTS